MESNLLCTFEPELKFDKDSFKKCYLTFLKKSVPLYCFILVFTIILVVLYLLWPSLINLYCAILWPFLATFLFVGLGGIYKVLRYKNRFENQLKNVSVQVYTDLFQISYTANGNEYTDRYTYTNLKKLDYSAKTEKLSFFWKSGAFFTFHKSDFTEEAFKFLSEYIK